MTSQNSFTNSDIGIKIWLVSFKKYFTNNTLNPHPINRHVISYLNKTTLFDLKFL